MGELVQFPGAGGTRGEPWMRQEEAARYLGVSVRTLHRWRQDGLPHHRAGKTVLYRASELDRFLTGRR